MSIKKTAAQFVLDHLGEIEHKIAMGIYHAAILTDLAEAGHEMTLATFRKCLSRARAKQKNRASMLRPTNNVALTQKFSGNRLTPRELIQLEQGFQHA
ncbi:hypothetical protein [Limnohabitans sp.]|uniref:hypothetical protein n=1 Tax=Limnohabitans sp. TaxID=1907725 RepID=UPI00286F6436|nr:hypothetical protein [Limnohabitans sp.]